MGVARRYVWRLVGAVGMCAVALVTTACPPPAPADPPVTTTPTPSSTVDVPVAGEVVTVSVPESMTVRAAQAAAVPEGPAEEFPVGALEVTVGQVPVGGSAVVTVDLPVEVDVVMKFVDGEWVRFAPEEDGSGGYLSENGRRVVLELVDGGRGDGDGVANGVIVDPVAPRLLGGGGVPSVAELEDSCAPTRPRHSMNLQSQQVRDADASARAAMVEYHAWLEGELKNMPPLHPLAGPEDRERWEEERDALVEHIATVGLLRSDLSRTFLFFDGDTERDGNEEDRIVEMFGNLETADHVAVFTPGVHSDLWSGYGKVTDSVVAAVGGVERLVERSWVAAARRICESAARQSGSANVATIAFLNYDSPDSGSLPGENSGDEINPAYAYEGAPRLAELVNTFIPAEKHTTLVAHSYGGLVSGIALWSGAAQGVDDLVLGGNQGVGLALSEALNGYSGDATMCRTREVAAPVLQLPLSVHWGSLERNAWSGHDVECLEPGVARNHVWAMQTPDDETLGDGAIYGQPTGMWPHGLGVFGRFPHFDDFGAHEMHTNCPLGDEPSYCGGFSRHLSSHGDYYNYKKSMAMRNTANVVVGRYHWVENERPGPFGVPQDWQPVVTGEPTPPSDARPPTPDGIGVVVASTGEGTLPRGVGGQVGLPSYLSALQVEVPAPGAGFDDHSTTSGQILTNVASRWTSTRNPHSRLELVYWANFDTGMWAAWVFDKETGAYTTAEPVLAWGSGVRWATGYEPATGGLWALHWVSEASGTSWEYTHLSAVNLATGEVRPAAPGGVAAVNSLMSRPVGGWDDRTGPPGRIDPAGTSLFIERPYTGDPAVVDLVTGTVSPLSLKGFRDVEVPSGPPGSPTVVVPVQTRSCSWVVPVDADSFLAGCADFSAMNATATTYALQVRNIDGTLEAELVNIPNLVAPTSRCGFTLLQGMYDPQLTAMSPDGNQVLIALTRWDGASCVTDAIYRVALDGAHSPVRVTRAQGAHWSYLPDGLGTPLAGARRAPGLEEPLVDTFDAVRAAASGTSGSSGSE